MIGAGRIAGAHARSFATNPEATLAWVADPVPELAVRIADASGAKATRDPQEAIEAKDVDAVLICSPTPTHVDTIIAAVRAGKPVLCEKPIDLSMARVTEFLEVIEGHDARVMMGFNRRFDPSFADVHERVAAGQIGDVEQVIVISRDPAPQSAEYLAASGGIFRDMTIHDFDMVRFFLPDIVEVSALGQNVFDQAAREAGDFDGALVTLRAAGGAAATIVNSRRCVVGYDQRLEVFGSRGMLSADNPLPTAVRSYGDGFGGRTDPYFNFFLERYADAYARELAAFIAAAASGEPFSPGLEDGRAALALADAADVSARKGAPVKIGADGGAS
jgi:myo-inositol 2-dehydrogenase/D-chiro-inositol 1-dehydrogenase